MVYHILKDGSRPTDITGHVVKMADAPAMYTALRELERRRKNVKYSSRRQSNQYT